MKHCLKLSIIFVFILGILFPSSKLINAASTYSATVTADVLNVREKATTKSKKVGSLKKGNKVTVYKKLSSGWSEIRYKNKKAYVTTKFLKFASNNNKVSFLRNKSKIYTYKSDEIGIYSYKYSEKYFEWNQWDFYVENEKQFSLVEKENSKGYYYGYPESESWMGIKYPIKVGQSWTVGYEGDTNKLKITSTNKTVKTPAGTFKKVVEVTDNEGYKDYYAPKVGLIKVTFKGSTVTQLIKIKNK